MRRILGRHLNLSRKDPPFKSHFSAHYTVHFNTNWGRDLDKVLCQHEEEKKIKYLDACWEAHLSFTPLVYLVDGMEGVEVSVARKHLDPKLAAVWNCQYS